LAESFRCNQTDGLFDGVFKWHLRSGEERNENMTENLIQAKLNQSFLLTFESLPTAGYNWTVNYDSQFLRLDNERFQSSRPEAIGSGGQQIFAFTPLRTGNTEVIAIYKRPWESKVEEERKFKIQISG
jgi:predicted secreted protein